MKPHEGEDNPTVIMNSHPQIHKISFFSNSPGDAPSVLRVLGPSDQLKFSVTQGMVEGQINYEAIHQGDIVVLQQEFAGQYDSYNSIMRLANQAGKPVIYDFHDLLFQLPKNHPDRLNHRLTSSLLPMFQAITEADLVTVPTPLLRNEIAKLHRRVVVLPDFLNDQLWAFRPLVKKSNDSILTIGFFGELSRKPDLEFIEPALLEILRRYPDKIRFHFWGVHPPRQMLSSPQVKWTPYLTNSYKVHSAYCQNQVADIWISPLADNIYNRCKSPIQYFEYTALGAASILSRLDPYVDVVNHGYNGLLASSLDEWVVCLDQLVNNDDLRYQLATKAQAVVGQQWLLSQNIALWKEAYENVSKKTDLRQCDETSFIEIVRLINGQNNGAIQELKEQVEKKDQSLQTISKVLSEKDKELAEIYKSKAWRLVLFLRKIRIELIPPKSSVEKLLKFSLRTLHIIRRDGFRIAIQQVAQTFKQRKNLLPVFNPIEQWNVIEDCTSCPLPAVSVFIELNSNFVNLKPEVVKAWATEQTLPEVEVAVWDSVHGKASSVGNNPHSWNAPDFETFCQGLAGRYLCAASPDLLMRNRNYLEVNLVALESENLAFTINDFGRTNNFAQVLENGYLPGNRLLPYFRQVLRKECARNDYSLDITGFYRNPPDQAWVVGKMIYHTTYLADTNEDIYPFETSLTGFSGQTLRGTDIIARANKRSPWDSVIHVLHPVQKVMPPLLEPSHMPTVIIFMPFLAVGGAEHLVLNLIQQLKEQVRFVVVTVENMDTSLGTTADEFHQITPYVYTAADYVAPQSMFSFISYLIEQFQADAFYIANGSNWIFDHLSLLRMSYPKLRIINQVYDHQFGWINRYDPKIASAIDAHISANPNITQAYADRGVNPNNIHFVEHAVNMEELDPAAYPQDRCTKIKEELGLPVDKKLITFCARLHPQKRPLDFVEMARRFANDNEVHFLLVGDGSLAPAVQNQIKRTGIKNITRLGFYSPITDIYAISDVIVLPSEYEAMPLVILESQAMGKPVVATNVGHIQDVINSTQGGFIVPQIGDIAALRMGVLKALHEPRDPVTMRLAIADRFGLPRIALQYLNVWLGGAPNA